MTVPICPILFLWCSYQTALWRYTSCSNPRGSHKFGMVPHFRKCSTFSELAGLHREQAVSIRKNDWPSRTRNFGIEATGAKRQSEFELDQSTPGWVKPANMWKLTLQTKEGIPAPRTVRTGNSRKTGKTDLRCWHFEDGYIDHFEVYEEILSPEFIRKHYSFVEAVSGTGAVKCLCARDPIGQVPDCWSFKSSSIQNPCI